MQTIYQLDHAHNRLEVFFGFLHGEQRLRTIPILRRITGI